MLAFGLRPHRYPLAGLRRAAHHRGPGCVYRTARRPDFLGGLPERHETGHFAEYRLPGAGALLYLGIHTGLQIWSTGIFGACYMALGVLLGALFVVTVICLPPVLSRFEGGAVTILRLAVYFSGRKLLRTALFAVLLALMFLAVDFFPLLLLVLPAVYADLFRGPIGRDMTRYIRENGLEEAVEPQPPQPEQEESALGALEWDRVLSGKAEEEVHGQH